MKVKFHLHPLELEVRHPDFIKDYKERDGVFEVFAENVPYGENNLLCYAVKSEHGVLNERIYSDRHWLLPVLKCTKVEEYKIDLPEDLFVL
jgi:hypothetical protein